MRPLLVPINLMQVPTVVKDLDEARNWRALGFRALGFRALGALCGRSILWPEAHRALQLCEILCAKLAFVGTGVQRKWTEMCPVEMLHAGPLMLGLWPAGCFASAAGYLG